MFNVLTRFGAICEMNGQVSRRISNVADDRQCLGVEVRHVDGFRIVPSSSAARIDCAISMATLSCASAVEAPRCGVLNQIRGGPKWRIVRQRLDLKNVEAAAAHVDLATRLPTQSRRSIRLEHNYTS
jgi:hypothetical protein